MDIGIDSLVTTFEKELLIGLTVCCLCILTYLFPTLVLELIVSVPYRLLFIMEINV